MPTYEVQSPDGHTLSIDGPTPPSKEALDQIFAAVKPKSSAPTAPPLVTQMGMRLKGGYSMNDGTQPEHPVMDSLSSLAHPETTGDMLALAIPTGIALATSPAVKAGAQAARGPVGNTIAKAGGAVESLSKGEGIKDVSRLAAAGLGVTGRIADAAATLAIPKAAEYLGAGMRKLGEVLSGVDLLSAQEIQALRQKLLDPKLAKNPMAKSAIMTAIKLRGGK